MISLKTGRTSQATPHPDDMVARQQHPWLNVQDTRARAGDIYPCEAGRSGCSRANPLPGGRRQVPSRVNELSMYGKASAGEDHMGPRGGYGERRLHAADPQLPLLKDYVNGRVPSLSTMSAHNMACQ